MMSGDLLLAKTRWLIVSNQSMKSANSEIYYTHCEKGYKHEPGGTNVNAKYVFKFVK